MDGRNENSYEKFTDQESRPGYGSGDPFKKESNPYGDNGDIYGGGGQMPGRDGSGFAIASLVLGIISLILFCTFINIPLAILSIVFGALALNKNVRRGMAIGGLVTGIISLVLLIIVCIAGFSLASQMMTPGSEWHDFYEGIQEGTFDYGDL